MSQTEYFTNILGIQDWEVIPEKSIVGKNTIIIEVRHRKGSGYHCSCCKEGVLFAYDHLPERLIRDFPVFGKACYLKVRRARILCSHCGVVVENLPWVDDYQHLTLRYERYLAHLGDIFPALEVAELDGLDKNTVYRLDKKWLALRKEKRILHPVRYLGIDEIALRKGQSYATVFYDRERREVVGIGKGRKERNVNRFFRRWGKEFCRQVKAVCMDLWSAYLNGVRRYCSKAVVVFDKFHIYKYLHEAVDTT